jgi:hypothetical protein
MLAGLPIKITAVLAIITILVGAFLYISGLRADLAISEMNNKTLQEGINTQQALIEQISADIAQIQNINDSLMREAERQRQEVRALVDKFDYNSAGNTRNFGVIAKSKPKLIERIINKGSVSTMRCLELASGATHTEKELAAKKPSETNSECPSLANPNYISTMGN